MEKKQKCEKKKVKEEEEPVYANVPIKGDRRRHHSGPSSYPKRINANSPERVNYLSPPLRYDRVAISPIHWSDRKEQMSPVDVEVDLVRGRPPASPKKPPDNLTIRQPLENPILDVKPESDSPVLKRTPEAMAKKTFNSPFSSLTRRSNGHSTMQSSTHLQQPSEKIQKKQDSPKPKKQTEKLVVGKPQENSVPKYDSMPTVPLSIKEQTSSLQKKRPDSPSPKMKRRMIKQSPSPVRRPRPKSFESEDSLPRKEKLEDRPVSVHGEVLMPGVVPPAIEYLRTKRGRGKVRSVKERHQRSHSVGPVQGSHTDLCYSASNLEHYARDRSDIKDTLSRSWGMEMFAKRTIFPQLLEGMDLKQNEGISNQAYEPDTLTRDAIWEKCVETADRMALNRSGSYENALEKGFISSSCSSPECRPKKEHSKNGKLYYVQSSEQDDVPLALKKYLGKKPARHRRSQDFEKALRELDEMYAKLDLETDHLYRPRPRGNRKSRSTEITLPLPTKTSSLKMNKNESPSQKAKRRARRERPHSYTGGLTTSDDSDDRHQIYNRFRHVKAKSSGKPIPGFPLTKLSHKYERFSPKIMAKNSSSSDDEYQPLHKSLSQGALNKHPDRSSSPSPEKRFQRTRRSKSADNFEKSIKAVTFAEPPKRPIGDLAIPSDISISQEDSPPVYLKMHQRQESSEVISGGDDSDSMCAQRGSTEHHISSSELDDADDEGDKELLSNKELPSNPVNSSTLSTINDEVLSKSFDALQTEYNVQSDITERFVQTQQQLTLNERKVSLLDEASIPMEDDSEDSEVKALMEPSVKSDKSKYKPVQVKPFFKSDRKKGKSTPSRKRMKKAKKEPGSPSSARRREVLEREGKTTRRKYQQSEERKQRIKNISSSSSDTDTDSEYSVDEEMSRTVSKLKAKITSEKHVETSAEKRRALFGDVGRSSSNPSSPLRKTEGKSWREPFRNADTEPDRYHRNRNRDESHKRYSRLTSERDYDLPSSPRRRMGSDSSESSVSRSEKDVKIDNTLKDRTSSTDSYPRLSPSYGIMDTQRSKSFDYDHRHSHLDNNHRTSDEILSKYTDDSLKDRTNDAKYNKDHVDSRAARKALLDNATKVKDDRHHSNDVVLKSTRQDLIDADSKTSRTKDIDYTTRRNLSRDEDLLSRRSSRDIVDRSGNDTYSSRYARTRDRTDEILMARLSDRQKYRSQKKEDEKEDKTHITTNGVTPPTATDLLLAKQAVAPKETERVIAMDTKLSADSSEDSDARAQRIAKYKEQRRKQLSEKYGIVGSLDSTADDLPSRRLRYSKRSNTDLGLTTDTLRRAEALIGKDKEDAPCETRPRRMASDVSIQKLDKDDYSYLRKKYGLERTPSTDTDTTSSKTSRNIDEDIASSRRSRLAKSTSLHDESPDVLPRRRRTIDVSPIVMETQETENKIKTVDDKSKVSATSAVIAEESPRTDSKPEISLETKELVEALETQRAARRERLRQTEILTTDKVSESILSKRRLSRDRSDLPQLAQTEDKEHDLKKRGEGTSIESPSIHERSKKVPEPEPVVPSGINVETQKVPSSIEQKNETSRHRPPTSGDIKTVDHSLQQSALVKDTMQGQRLRQPIGKESELLGKDSERKPRFYSLDSEASIESSSAAFESPSDSDSLSLASDIVRTMSPRSLEILERKRRRKEEKKALRRRSALNTPSKEDGRISPRSGSGDDSDGRQRFKQRQISPSSSQDDTGKSDSDQRVIQPSGGLKVTTPSDIMPESVPMRKSDIVPKKLEELKVEEKPEKGERERNEIKKVEQVDVHSVKVSEKGEHERNEIKKVEQVDVHSVKVSEKGEHERNEIKKVEQVDVHSAKVPEEGKHEIKDILKEEQVDVSSVKASEPDVSERKELAKEIKKEVAVVQKPVTETDGLEKRNDKEAGEKELERVIKADKARSPEMQPEQKKGAIAEGKQTKKLIEKLQGKKASTEKRKVLAEKVEESQRVLKEVRQKMGKHSGTQDEKSVPVAPAKVVADDVPKTIEERPKEFSKVREHPKSAETVKIAKQAENESKRDVPSHGVPDKRAGLIKSPRSTETDVPKIAKQRVSRTEKEEQRVTPVAKEEHLDSSKVDIKKDEKIKVRAQPKKLLSPEARKKPMVGRVDTSKTAQKRELTTKRPESLPVRGMTDKRIVDRGTSDSDKSDKSDPKSPRKSASSSSQPLRRPVSPEKKLRPKPEPSTKSPSPTSKADRTPSSRLGLRRTDSPLSSTDDETSSPRRKPRKRPEIPSVLKEAETRRTSPEPWRRRTTGSDSSDSDSRKVRLRGSGSDREERIKRFGKQTPKIKEESAAAKAPLRTRSSEQKKGTPKSVEESSKRSEKRETTASPLRITEPNVEPPKTRDISVRKLVQPRKGDPSTVKEIPCSETVKHYTKEEKTELPKKILDKVEATKVHAAGQVKNTAKAEELKITDSISKAVPRIEKTGKSPVEKVEMAERFQRLSKSPSLESAPDSAFLSVENKVTGSSLRRTASFKTKKELEKEREADARKETHSS
uniref:Microtubule-associated protein futsch-like n=1 Tax=Saccoglossus kowalevskii TaxID=10224 RepID=A0ABM0MVV1_SACKO|nr:PREDICTED: microtubule-associated protein futsch-like [Saccoglossus kowalevskii]